MPGAERRARLCAARLYLICDSTPGARPLREVLEPALAGGVDIFQLRDKRLDERELRACALQARAVCQAAGALFIVNDDPALARDVHADGLHLGQQDATLAAARAIVGD
jgi:thiamine-phosphate pyrophosphorylase